MSEQAPQIYAKNNKLVAPISFLKAWKDNPRFISEEDFKRLEVDVKGEQIKPLLITGDGTVIGGNMRYEAYKRQDRPEVWVSVVTFRRSDHDELIDAYVNGEKDQTFDSEYDAMMHYSLVDNQEYGKYDKQLTAEKLSDVALPLDHYKLNFVDVKSLDEILAEFGPSDEEEAAEPEYKDEAEPEYKDEKVKEPKTVKCPHCGEQFEV